MRKAFTLSLSSNKVSISLYLKCLYHETQIGFLNKTSNLHSLDIHFALNNDKNKQKADFKMVILKINRI
jgi:hypothetical protein